MSITAVSNAASLLHQWAALQASHQNAASNTTPSTASSGEAGVSSISAALQSLLTELSAPPHNPAPGNTGTLAAPLATA